MVSYEQDVQKQHNSGDGQKIENTGKADDTAGKVPEMTGNTQGREPVSQCGTEQSKDGIDEDQKRTEQGPKYECYGVVGCQ